MLLMLYNNLRLQIFKEMILKQLGNKYKKKEIIRLDIKLEIESFINIP